MFVFKLRENFKRIESERNSFDSLGSSRDFNTYFDFISTAHLFCVFDGFDFKANESLCSEQQYGRVCPDYFDRADLPRAENRCLYSDDTLKARSM